MNFHAVRFTVEGAGRFPLDMLRYDRAVPDAQADVFLLDRLERRRVRLISFVPASSPRRGPTLERWRSFGWDVVEGPEEVR